MRLFSFLQPSHQSEFFFSIYQGCQQVPEPEAAILKHRGLDDSLVPSLTFLLCSFSLGEDCR